MKTGTGDKRHNGTNKRTGDGRKKWYGMAAALLALVLGLCTLTPIVRAAEARTEESEQLAAWTGLSSRGSLVYREEEKGAQIYAADFLLLRDRLNTIPDTVFEPACYTHTHHWEYLHVNGETHTRHCESCGDAFDLVDPHRAERWENCTISYGGAEYPGIRYTCACGYQWEREEAHTLLFEAVDATCHRSRCCLEGTPFCAGYEPVTEEHYAFHYIPCEDGCHHERICMDCGYRDEEECSFSLSDADSGEEDDSGGNNENESGNDGGSGNENGNGDNGTESSIRRCWCGNVEKTDTTVGDENASAGAGDGEPPSGEEGGDENAGAGAESEENASDTENGDGNPEADTEENDAPGDETEEENADAE